MPPTKGWHPLINHPLLTNLKQTSKFYKIYSQDEIGQKDSDQLTMLPVSSTSRKFPLGWSHYLKLMRIENAEERQFYEIEAYQNQWGLKELEHQFVSFPPKHV